MEYHIDSHHLLERIKSNRDIEQVCPNDDYSSGLAICPLCWKTFSCHEKVPFQAFIHFYIDYSKEEGHSSSGLLEFCHIIHRFASRPSYHAFITKFIEEHVVFRVSVWGILAN
jgi:hypothetical protein